MAEVLKKLPPRNRGCGGRPNIYDWDELLDGRPRKLKRGIDFHCQVQSLRQNARLSARLRGKTVAFYIEDDDTVYIQANG